MTNPVRILTPNLIEVGQTIQKLVQEGYTISEDLHQEGTQYTAVMEKQPTKAVKKKQD